MKRLLLSSLLLAVLVACASTEKSVENSGFVKLTGAQISGLLPGNSLKGTDRSGEYVIYYTSNNTMKIVHNGRPDTGRWRISGDEYCRQWTKLGKGKERCVTMHKRGDAINWVRNDKITDRSFLMAGNPADL